MKIQWTPYFSERRTTFLLLPNWVNIFVSSLGTLTSATTEISLEFGHKHKLSSQKVEKISF